MRRHLQGTPELTKGIIPRRCGECLFKLKALRINNLLIRLSELRIVISVMSVIPVRPVVRVGVFHTRSEKLH
jgi:hypothetical protein